MKPSSGPGSKPPTSFCRGFTEWSSHGLRCQAGWLQAGCRRADECFAMPRRCPCRCSAALSAPAVCVLCQLFAFDHQGHQLFFRTQACSTSCASSSPNLPPAFCCSQLFVNVATRFFSLPPVLRVAASSVSPPAIAAATVLPSSLPGTSPPRCGVGASSGIAVASRRGG